MKARRALLSNVANTSMLAHEARRFRSCRRSSLTPRYTSNVRHLVFKSWSRFKSNGALRYKNYKIIIRRWEFHINVPAIIRQNYTVIQVKEKNIDTSFYNCHRFSFSWILTRIKIIFYSNTVPGTITFLITIYHPVNYFWMMRIENSNGKILEWLTFRI